MPRYFIALPLPEEAKGRLVAIQPPAVPGMRILAREELHLTLHFLGEVAANDIEIVRAALATVRMNAFTIGLSGVGMFSSERHTKVLWAGVEANEDLTALHRCIGSILSSAIGFRPEYRPYSPHITLARLDEPTPSGVIERYLEENKAFVVPSVRIDRFILFSSRFVENVPKYQEEAAYPLLRAEQAQMGPKTRTLCDRLRETADLLRRVGEHHWCAWLEESSRRIENGDFSGIEHLRSAFGGTGSFNDLVILPINGHSVSDEESCGVNAQLSDLRHEIFELADYIRHNAEIMDH